MSQKHKYWAVAMLMVIVLVLSSILGSAISDRERTTGGMETKWKMGIHTGVMGMDTIQSNDSIIINDIDAKEIKVIDSGGVVWSYSYSSLMSFNSYNGHICILDQQKDTRTFMVFATDGSLSSRFTDSNVFLGFLGVDGNYYIEVGDDYNTDTIPCYGSDGLLKWLYHADNGSIAISAVNPDGSVILRHNIESWNSTMNADVLTGREFISISPNGIVQGRFDLSYLPLNTYSYAERANNGTLCVYSRNENTSTVDVMGMTEDLQQLWSKTYGTIYGPSESDGSIKGEGSVIYRTSSRNVTGDYGVVSLVSTLSAFDSSTGSYLYKTDFNGGLQDDGAQADRQRWFYHMADRPGRDIHQ